MRGVILESWVDGYVDGELVCLKSWKNASFGESGESGECGMEVGRLIIETEQNWSRVRLTPPPAAGSRWFVRLRVVQE